MPNALNRVFPSEMHNIENLIYHDLATKEAVLESLARREPLGDIVVGWSLGGKLAARATAAGLIKPKLLVLIGTPFQYIPDGGIENVIKRKPYRNFYEAFESEPEATRTAFIEYIVEGDTREKSVRANLVLDMAHDSDWLRWLIGMKFGSEDLDFSAMPRTLIVHGKHDAIINLRQPALYAEHIAGARVELLEGCGHAPHLHAPETIAGFIREEWERLHREG